jgi:hypothetical protein
MTRAEEMGLEIVKFEGRYVNGKLQVYYLSEANGGGSFEVAGVNDRYHPTTATRLRDLIKAGEHEKAEREAADYIADYTKAVLKFFPDDCNRGQYGHLEFILRDTCFNRGAKGAATVLQVALKMQDIDGVVGPATKAEFAKQLAELGADQLAFDLSQARETYERTSYPWKKNTRDESSRFWSGLSNRWKKSHQIALNRFA